MQVNKIGFTKTNDFSIKQHSKNAINSETKPDTEFGKYSSDNLKANYMVNFKGNISGQSLIHDNDDFYSVNNETRFFREPYTDEIVQNYILDKFSNDSKINVVSGACSTGEEAKSYAMMLDSLGDKLNVFGFDISDDAIKQSTDSMTRLILDISYPLCPDFDKSSQCSEKFLVDGSSKNLTPYQKTCQEKFRKYFDKIGETYEEPRFPNALNEVLKIQEFYKKISPEATGLDEDEWLEKYGIMAERIADRLNSLMVSQGDICTYQNFKAKVGSFDNCSYKQGDILNLEQLYKPNSVHALLYRNALYHTLCMPTPIGRMNCDNAQEKMNNIAKQMNKVVKKDGLVVFGENENKMGNYADIINIAMKDNGFRKLVQNNQETDNVWVKVEDINENE